MGVKISELNEATSAQNSDVLPIVQNEETKKISVETLGSQKVNKSGDTLTGGLLFENKNDFNAIRKTRTLNGTDYQVTVGLGGNGSARMEYVTNDKVLSSIEARSDGLYNGVSGKKLAEQESSGDLDMQSNSVKFGNNGNILWKESGYGDKFAIKADFSGADDNNKLKIQGAVGGAGTDPNLIDLINISGKTGATTFIGSVASPNFIGAINSYTWDVKTENTNDTWLLVLNNSKIQHRTVNSVIDSCVKRNDGNQQINGMITVEAVNSPNTYNNNVITSEPNLCITSTGKFRRTTNTSSVRYKKDIENVKDEGLSPERLYDLQVKQFKYKEEYQPNKNDSRYEKNLIGFIAEDVEKVFPIAVDYTEDDNGNKIVDNWNGRYIIPPMLKLIQNQKKKIDELEDRIKILEER